jgi:alkylhydroperoxidase family enzyme
MRQRSIVISACASSVGDSYCSLVWGAKLAGFTDSRVAASVLLGDDAGLDPDEQVLARWARSVSTSPSDTTAQHIEELRATGRIDRQIFALTLFVAMRAAFACRIVRSHVRLRGTPQQRPARLVEVRQPTRMRPK